MQRLNQIQLQKTVTVKLQCNINDQIVIKNIKILMDCIKDLNTNHNDLLSKFTKITDRLTNLQQNNNSNNNQQLSHTKQNNQKLGLNQSDKQNLYNLIKKLDERTGNNQKNILDNIKDINLINKQIGDLKQIISKISNNGSNNSSADSGRKNIGDNSSLSLQNINNMNKDIHNSKDLIAKTNQQLDKLRKEVQSMKDKFGKKLQDHDKRILNLQNSSGNNNNDSNNNNGNNSNNQTGTQDLNKAEFNQLKQKIAILNKKTNGLQLMNQNFKTQIIGLGEGQDSLQKKSNDLTKQISQLKQQLNNLLKNNKANNDKSDKSDKTGVNINSQDLRQIKNQLKQLRNEIQQLKRDNNNHSKTSIEEDKKNKFERGTFTQMKFKDDSLKDLIARIQYLEKMIGSKNSIDGKQKFPLIKRNKIMKEKDMSIQQKSTSKKDIADLKAQIQAWFNNYLMQTKNKDNFEDLELKIQQIKNNLNKKADQQGMKKGLTFLQSKINQLYLFLTQPQGDDAMIVRKGFNCLSCSKKVQKIRGKIGPHINWNNMTSTNYSPPKVGYSRHMGQDDREEDQ